jgi:hypothetical protein
VLQPGNRWRDRDSHEPCAHGGPGCAEFELRLALEKLLNTPLFRRLQRHEFVQEGFENPAAKPACFSDCGSAPTEAALATLPFNSIFCFARSRRLPLHIRWIIRAAASEGFDVIDHIPPARAVCLTR